MRCRQPVPNSSSDDSDGLDLESCFDAEDEVEEADSDANPTDINTDIKGGDVTDSVMEIDWSGVD